MSPDAQGKSGDGDPQDPHHADSSPMSSVDRQAKQLLSDKGYDWNNIIFMLASSALRMKMVGGFNKAIENVKVFFGGLVYLLINIIIGLACVAWYIVAVYISHKGWSNTLVTLHEKSFSFNFTTILAFCTGTGTVVAPGLLEKAVVTLDDSNEGSGDGSRTSRADVSMGIAKVSLLAVAIIILLDSMMLCQGFMVMMVAGYSFMAGAPYLMYALAIVGAIGVALTTLYIAKQISIHEVFKLVAHKVAVKKIIDEAAKNGDDPDITKLKMDIANLRDSDEKFRYMGVIALVALAAVCLMYNFPIKLIG